MTNQTKDMKLREKIANIVHELPDDAGYKEVVDQLEALILEQRRKAIEKTIDWLAHRYMAWNEKGDIESQDVTDAIFEMAMGADPEMLKELSKTQVNSLEDQGGEGKNG